MTILNTSVLTDKAKSLFKTLAASKELEGLTLMGGTALALQIGHRISLDFDFATFSKTLPLKNIDEFIARLKSTGLHQVQEITDGEREARFRINYGESLRNYARDYVIDDIKVTFFSHGKTQPQREFYKQEIKIREDKMSFDIMGVGGLKVSKMLVLADRVRSRDLYDLMILMNHYDYKLTDALEMVKQIGHIDDPEHYRAVMTSVIKLDEKDEGLKPVNIDYTMPEIYQFFDKLFEAHDIQKAKTLFSK